MFLTRKHVARRTVLKAAGVKLALPLRADALPRARPHGQAKTWRKQGRFRAFAGNIFQKYP